MPQEFTEFFGSMINADDPRHARLRRIVSRGFTPRRLADLADVVDRTTTAIVDDLIEAGECDAVETISARLPLTVICQMMGVPQSQYRFVYDRTNVILGAADPEYVPDTGEIVPALLRSGAELAELMREMGRARLAEPTDDVTSALVNAEIDGERLTPDELASFFILLVITSRMKKLASSSGVSRSPSISALTRAEVTSSVGWARDRAELAHQPGQRVARPQHATKTTSASST